MRPIGESKGSCRVAVRDLPTAGPSGGIVLPEADLALGRSGIVTAIDREILRQCGYEDEVVPGPTSA